MIQTRAEAALSSVHITPGTATVARAKFSFHANECRCIYNSRLKDNSRMTARERPQLIAFSANLLEIQCSMPVRYTTITTDRHSRRYITCNRINGRSRYGQTIRIILFRRYDKCLRVETSVGLYNR